MSCSSRPAARGRESAERLPQPGQRQTHFEDISDNLGVTNRPAQSHSRYARGLIRYATPRSGGRGGTAHPERRGRVLPSCEAPVCPQSAIEAAGPVNRRALRAAGIAAAMVARWIPSSGFASGSGGCLKTREPRISRAPVAGFRTSAVAKAAAERLAELPEWKAVAVVKSNRLCVILESRPSSQARFSSRRRPPGFAGEADDLSVNQL